MRCPWKEEVSFGVTKDPVSLTEPFYSPACFQMAAFKVFPLYIALCSFVLVCCKQLLPNTINLDKWSQYSALPVKKMTIWCVFGFFFFFYMWDVYKHNIIKEFYLSSNYMLHFETQWHRPQLKIIKTVIIWSCSLSIIFFEALTFEVFIMFHQQNYMVICVPLT